MQKLGKNRGGYFGETINLRAGLREIASAAQHHGWAAEIFHAREGCEWFALHRKPVCAPTARLYVSAGIHGDEPASLMAAIGLIQENRWPAGLEIFLLPCLNPLGFLLNRRENPEGVDLNRDYRNSKAAETRAHIAWLERQPTFDLYLCLHEDWESHGFYLYEQNPDNRFSFAEKIIQSVAPVCPIDRSEIIEGRPAQNGIIRPIILPQERPDWPEALYLINHKARQGYTLEAPSDFPLAGRVAALIAAVNVTAELLDANAPLRASKPSSSVHGA